MTETLNRDPQGSRDARDKGIDQVMTGEERFATRVTGIVKRLPFGWEGIGEDIRLLYAEAGYPPPHHPNCWGGVINSCVRAGMLKLTGDWRHMAIRRSHRRMSPEYRRVPG